jgi:RNA polymerase sigma-70 factor (ECF subfamily)
MTFDAVYEQHVDTVYAYCHRQLGQRELAEDATSITFTKALQAFPSFHGDAHRAWLLTIARNTVIDLLRRQRPTVTLNGELDVADGEPSPEEQALGRDEERSLDALLGHLTAEQREVVELRLSGLSGAEIAAAIGKEVAAVNALQYRAVRRLRDLQRDALAQGERR